MTYHPAPQFGVPQPPQRKRNHGIWIVVAAGVLGVFVFCGIVVAAAGNTGKPADTEDASRNNALAAPATTPPATTEAPATTPAEVSTSVTAPATATTKAPTPAKTTPTKKPPTTTKPPASDCHPSYRPCVPIASDVDCAGGGGNGPKYVRGPITVIGPDVYDLDRDGDGVACE